MDRKNFLLAWASLTPREKRTIEMLSLGFTTSEIAEYEGIKKMSVLIRKSRIYHKLGIAHTDEQKEVLINAYKEAFE